MILYSPAVLHLSSQKNWTTAIVINSVHICYCWYRKQVHTEYCRIIQTRTHTSIYIYHHVLHIFFVLHFFKCCDLLGTWTSSLEQSIWRGKRGRFLMGEPLLTPWIETIWQLQCWSWTSLKIMILTGTIWYFVICVSILSIKTHQINVVTWCYLIFTLVSYSNWQNMRRLSGRLHSASVFTSNRFVHTLPKFHQMLLRGERCKTTQGVVNTRST